MEGIGDYLTIFPQGKIALIFLPLVLISTHFPAYCSLKDFSSFLGADTISAIAPGPGPLSIA